MTEAPSKRHLFVSWTVCTALTAACKLIGPEVITAVLPTVVELLNHPKELVRKKAVMVLHRFQQLDPGHEMLTGVDLDGYFRQALCDKVSSSSSSEPVQIWGFTIGFL